GYAKRAPADKERWSKLVDGYMQEFAADGRAKLIVQLIDAKAGVTRDDEVMLNWLIQCGVPFIIAATKVDKLNKTDRAASLDEIARIGVPVIPFSALSGEGKNEILGEIMKYM
ncbi:MAG: GTP-binding protein, partial [Eubacteriales bacterium]